MSYLSQLYLPGALAIWCALAFLLSALWGYAQSLRGDPSGLLFARRAYRFFALSIVATSGVLLTLLLLRDFRIEYVYQYSGAELPWFYQLSAFWAGQKGSFLIWLTWGALLGLPLWRSAGREEASVMGVYCLTQLGLLFILVRENPFVMLPQTPTDGSGLNPLLQDNWMVIHPPIMFIGYAATAIPFSFAIAAMWRKRFDRWAHLAFPWALGGFLVLGTAILMGGYWAYKTLGWGGYWGWDPVENASLIPWIIGTVLIHGLQMERQQGRFRRSNLVIACLLYLSVLYGTFLTRSGVLADFSVHSFVDLGISGWLLALMAFFIGISVILLATRLRLVPTKANEDAILSRGSFLLLATLTLGVSALVITIGTSAPLLTSFQDNPGQVGPEFYNRVNLPIALLVALLLSLVPYLTWKGTAPRDLLRRIALPGLAALVVTVVAGVLGVRQPFHVLFVLLASLALGSNLQKTIEVARRQGLRLAGGYLAHVGVGIILLGILASSAYDQSVKVTLEQGVTRRVDDMELTFLRYIPRQGREKERMEIEVVRDDGSRYFAYPKLFMNDRTRQVMAQPHIRKLVSMDLYISPIEFDPGEPMGGLRRVQMARGEEQSFGDLSIRFVGFDMQAEGNAMLAMNEGKPVTVGATLEVRRGDEDASPVVPLYRFSQSGAVESPTAALPGGGRVAVAAINASSGAVVLDLAGLSGEAASGSPARLSIDVTRKPLINLVWYGLYVVLAGGLLATGKRLREALLLERLATEGDGG